MWNECNYGNTGLDTTNHKPTCTPLCLHSALVTNTGTGNDTVVTPNTFGDTYCTDPLLSAYAYSVGRNECPTAKCVPNSEEHCVLYLEYCMQTNA